MLAPPCLGGGIVPRASQIVLEARDYCNARAMLLVKYVADLKMLRMRWGAVRRE